MSSLIEPHDTARRLTHGIDAIDAPMVVAGTQIQSLLPLDRNVFGMFDHGAIHVRDPQRAVGPGAQHGGPEPVVARGQEFGLLLILRRAG